MVRAGKPAATTTSAFTGVGEESVIPPVSWRPERLTVGEAQRHQLVRDRRDEDPPAGHRGRPLHRRAQRHAPRRRAVLGPLRAHRAFESTVTT